MLKTIGSILLHVLFAFVPIWTGLANYTALKALEVDGFLNLLSTLTTTTILAYLLEKEWALHTLGLMSAICLVFVSTLSIGAPITLLLLLPLLGIAVRMVKA